MQMAVKLWNCQQILKKIVMDNRSAASRHVCWTQGRQLTTLSGRTVYVYNGEGTAYTPFRDVYSYLQTCLSHPVQPISAQQIKEGQWKKNCAAIVFGGGQAGGYVKALGKEGARMILDFVHEGGTYLRICAGAYLACERVVFDKGGKHEVCEKRPLGFFKGLCEGPITPYYDPERAWILPVSFLPAKLRVSDDTFFHKPNSDVITIPAYVIGGGKFLIGSSEAAHASRTQVLAHFSNVDGNPAAVVKCEVGCNGGVAILSGPHCELMTSHYDERCWRQVLTQGKLQTVTNPFKDECQV